VALGLLASAVPLGPEAPSRRLGQQRPRLLLRQHRPASGYRSRSPLPRLRGFPVSVSGPAAVAPGLPAARKGAHRRHGDEQCGQSPDLQVRFAITGSPNNKATDARSRVEIVMDLGSCHGADTCDLHSYMWRTSFRVDGGRHAASRDPAPRQAFPVRRLSTIIPFSARGTIFFRDKQAMAALGAHQGRAELSGRDFRPPAGADTPAPAGLQRLNSSSRSEGPSHTDKGPGEPALISAPRQRPLQCGVRSPSSWQV